MAETMQRARDLFNLVAAKVCCPATGAAPCIPFVYPDDGCWGRAHEMCRLMLGAGATPAKVWIYGSLHVVSVNKPDCNVYWGWHVAPTLTVATGSGNTDYVIDPSLFNEPVTVAVWKSVQGDPTASVVPSSADVFYRSFSGSTETDPTYAETNTVLNTYRNELRLRATGASGPPPYPTCIVKPAGVQWIGTVEAGATRRWFTYNWSEATQMEWTMMPLTPCPGRAQLKWDVAVERSDASRKTYWITVTNLTNETVRFEGRFNRLV